MARILVTGAAGFIGRAVCRGLADRGHTVFGATRRPADPIPGIQFLVIASIGPQPDWSGYLTGIEIVVHLANRAHRPARDVAAADEAEAAAMLAHAAAKAG